MAWQDKEVEALAQCVVAMGEDVYAAAVERALHRMMAEGTPLPDDIAGLMGPDARGSVAVQRDALTRALRIELGAVLRKH